MHSEKKTMNTVYRACELMRILAFMPEGLAFNRLQKLMSNIPSPTLARLLKALLDIQWVKKNQEGRYLTGDSFLYLSAIASETVHDENLIKSSVTELALLSEESSMFASFFEDSFVFTEKHEMPNSFHYIDINVKNNAHIRHGCGKVCLAYQHSNVIKKIIAKYKNELPAPEHKILAELKEIRDNSFFISKESLAVRFIAPVFSGTKNTFRGAIGISLVARSLSEKEIQKYREKVILIAGYLTQALGKKSGKNIRF
ncbi:MAG: hypothetical protein A2096_07360 [Spirochaetes bacterium GWF1_41_5]|nr:MAG: hypothetical protein A2096_07360 [Spirochaetes bacterium GWF1_41_5]